MKRIGQRMAIGMLGVLFGMGPALADYPDSVLGVWHGVSNQTAVTVTIRSQGPAGTCRSFVGTISPANSTIQGFYCHDTGRISFVRKTTATNDTFQAYGGNAAADAAIDRLSGTFASVVNPLGDYSWYLTK